MDLNQWTREIHELAVLKGWWEKPRIFAEIIALCHSDYEGGKPCYERKGKN